MPFAKPYDARPPLMLLSAGLHQQCASCADPSRASAVGIVGGEPKCCKSFLGLRMAVSVVAGAVLRSAWPARAWPPSSTVSARSAAVLRRLPG